MQTASFSDIISSLDDHLKIILESPITKNDHFNNIINLQVFKINPINILK